MVSIDNKIKKRQLSFAFRLKNESKSAFAFRTCERREIFGLSYVLWVTVFCLFVCFCTFVFPLNPLVKSTVSWKTTPFRCRSRKIFLARKKTASTFWREKWLFLFWGDLKGQNRWPGQIYSQKDESFLRPLRNTFTRCLTLIPSDKFWRNFLHFDTKELWGTKTIDFQESSKIRVNCFFRQIKLPKKRSFEFKKTYLKATLLFKRVLSETKKKFFWARWREKILSRQRAQKTFAWLHTAFLSAFETDTFLLSRGTNFLHLFSKRWKFFTHVTKHFYTLLPLISSDKFCRNFFLWTVDAK